MVNGLQRVEAIFDSDLLIKSDVFHWSFPRIKNSLVFKYAGIVSNSLTQQIIRNNMSFKISDQNTQINLNNNSG